MDNKCENYEISEKTNSMSYNLIKDILNDVSSNEIIVYDTKMELKTKV